jgi:ElaB/YqjD/DUF883 family membrane-anchored ribosome-binding protein
MDQTTKDAGNEELREQLETLRADLSALSDTVQRQAKQRIGDAQDMAAEKFDDLEAQIRRKPLTSAAIAAGVGFLLGAILSR